jgi:hypothetical protein
MLELLSPPRGCAYCVVVGAKPTEHDSKHGRQFILKSHVSITRCVPLFALHGQEVIQHYCVASSPSSCRPVRAVFYVHRFSVESERARCSWILPLAHRKEDGDLQRVLMDVTSLDPLVSSHVTPVTYRSSLQHLACLWPSMGYVGRV